MKKLTEHYPELIHVTCVAYSLHRVCETIHVFYPNVNKLVATEIKIFVKLSATTEIFKDKLLQTPFPPNSSNYILGSFTG
jgi:hypothetical protein